MLQEIMKELRWFWKAALLSAFVLINQGCQTARWVDAGPPFRDAASTDVVLRFSRWDYISISQPDYREDGFIRHLKREELGRTFDGLGLRRDTAVVVLGWTYQDEMLNSVVADWKTVLQQCCFRLVHVGPIPLVLWPAQLLKNSRLKQVVALVRIVGFARAIPLEIT